MKAPASAQTIEYEQATSYRRLAARFIDLIFAWLVLFTLAMVPLSIATAESSISDEAFGGLTVASWAVAVIAYDTLMHRLFGRTIGKALLGMRVVDVRGNKLGWGRCLLRAVVLYVTVIAVAFGIAITASILGWIILRALPQYARFPHDQAARSFVVRAVKGKLKRVAEAPVAPGVQQKPTPLADLEKLRAQGIISAGEYERKKRELGL